LSKVSWLVTGDGVRRSKLWKKLLDVEQVVLEGEVFETGPGGAEILVIGLRPDRRHRLRCPLCGCRRPYRDDGEGRRRWRAMDMGVMQCFLEAGAPRVACPRHGVVVAAVPWARHGSRFTRAFEDWAAWLAAAMPGKKAARLARITWRSLQAIVTRVVAELAGKTDRLERLRRIGIDEICWRDGEYLMAVTDHDTGKLVWAAPGRCQDTVRAFFTALGPDRARLLTHVSADGAEWIHDVIREHAPQSAICLDPFHVVKWAGEALDELRRRLARELRAAGQDDQAATLGSGMWALRKKPENLTGTQRTSLAGIATDNRQLYKGYLMKEQLRAVFTARGGHGRALLAGLIAWAQRSRIPEFAKLARTLKRLRPLIWNTLGEGGVSNARSENTNTHLRTLISRAYGFGSAAALIAMATLTRGGLCPELPGR
jgi:transposase